MTSNPLHTLADLSARVVAIDERMRQELRENDAELARIVERMREPIKLEKTNAAI